MNLKSIFKTILLEGNETRVKKALETGDLESAQKEAEIIGTELMNKPGNANANLAKRLMPLIQSLYDGANETELKSIFNALRTGDSTNNSYQNEFNSKMRITKQMFKRQQTPF